MIDFHLHIKHLDRNLEDTIAHIEGLGCEKAVLLPLEDIDGGLLCTTDEVLEAKQRYPERVLPFCHVDVRRDNALRRVEDYAKRGCLGYGEQKQRIHLNDPRLDKIFAFCNEMGWPVTLHLQEGKDGYNWGVEYLETLLRKFPKAKFIGHAQSWWANISASVPDPSETLYPTGKVVPGGLADRLLAEYPNMYADLSAGSGLGALSRDEDFTKGFLLRHRKKLLFATDCPCLDGKGGGYKPGCFGQKSLPLLRRLADENTLRDILHNNAIRLLGITK